MKLGFSYLKSNFSNIPSYLKIHIISFILLIFLTVLIIAWVIRIATLDAANCDKIKRIKDDTIRITSSVSPSTPNNNKLKNYYVKTAYNACSSGNFKNDFVNLCALENVIKQGTRCIDFQIYSLKDEPVVATSSVNKYNIKETYNSVKFDKVLQMINKKAFNFSSCPNPTDPIIIHLRIMSKNKIIYDKMTESISNIIRKKTLGPNYSYTKGENIIGDMTMSELSEKIVIMVDNSNPFFQDTSLSEYINITSNSNALNLLRYTADIKYAPDTDIIKYHNKSFMSIVLPDISNLNTNYNANVAWDCGCQFVAMSFQNLDTELINYNLKFNESGTAFILKPEELRENVTIQTDTDTDKKNIYTEKIYKSDYYNFTI